MPGSDSVETIPADESQDVDRIVAATPARDLAKLILALPILLLAALGGLQFCLVLTKRRIS
ncbi:MAG TPA: hypothetical protein VGN57_08505 [Pirellulaceae bacterium]|nr:hypothetical protein [Pirellulaceae bacterium]